MKKGVMLVFIFLTSVLSSISAMAQSLEASVNKTQAVKNEVINLRIMADTELSSDAIDFSVLDKDFFLGQPRYGRSSNNINGRKYLRTEWSISIAPMKEGVLTIPSFTVDGMSTDPIKLRVTASQTEPDLDDLFSFSMSVDNHTLYPQQSANLRMRLIIKADIRRLDNPKIIPPSIDGMKLEPVGEMQQGQQVMDGLEVTVVEQSFRLTADTAGTYTLNGPQLTGSYIYGDSLTGSTKVMPIKTNIEQMPITVKAIPAEFQGKWLPASALEMTQSWQDDQGNKLSPNELNKVKQGSSITRTIQIKARGTQAEFLPRIDMDYPTSLRVYPEQPQFATTRDGTLVMTVKQVIIPTEVGTYSLPGYTLNWWNSIQDEAKKATIEAIELDVEQSDMGLITLPETTLPQTPATTVTPPAQGGVSEPWRVLTFVFAGLWVITSIITVLVWKKRPHESKNQEINSQAPLNVDGLKAVIKQGDAAKIERAINEYLDANRESLNSEVVEAVKHDLEVMNQARFSAEQQPWNSDSLLDNINKLSKAKKTQSSPQLEKL
ncbi:BatD family protein [Vibrio natriegens]|uniref:BatD family protein n=1 Tax=Vibrio natriegens TaxID=691 RepID=UPI001EFDBAB9|nr:BatD family protein [Vibrio natriegens]MCG9698600.1 BatD family protein [Vibrio natriegens]